MKKLGIVIQGKAFLKSMIPLALFATREGFVPHLMLFRERPGKPHDNLNFPDLQVSLNKVCNALEKNIEIYFSIVESENQIYDICKSQDIDVIIGQDAQYHLKHLSTRVSQEKDNKVKVFSICNFFDSLHHACDLSKSDRRIIEVDAMFFPDKRFEACHEKILGNYSRKYEKFSIGNTFYDHYLLNKLLPTNSYQKDGIVFFTTLQYLVPKDIQDELEVFLTECLENNTPVYVKEKLKTPWVFKSKMLNSLPRIVEEKGIPGTSFSMMLNTKMQISSYSTSAVEAEYFGKPTLNIGSVEKEKLTDSVRRIKHEFGILQPFSSECAVTANKDFKRHAEMILSREKSPKENITLESNSTLRILRQIKKCL